MFERLVLPLKIGRAIDVMADFADETSAGFRRHRYEFHDIDIILLEGIFLFKRKFASHFDLKIWIECSFETAIRRAIIRSQEGLDRDATITAYESIYFPAQRYHFQTDEPQSAVDFVYVND